MNGKSIPELARRLKREGIATGKITGSRLPMLLDGREFHLGRGYQLVTWQRSPNRTAVAHGHKSRAPKQRRLEPTPPPLPQAHHKNTPQVGLLFFL